MPVKQAAAAPISFKTTVTRAGTWTIIRLPKDASAKLPSRGQVMVEGTVNGSVIKTPLEPDGMSSHWLKVDNKLAKSINAKTGGEIKMIIRVTKDWSEPEVPADWRKMLDSDPKVKAVWEDITPMARWEWIRWMRATNRDETRQKRIAVGQSKIRGGWRRPCCWNRNLCSVPEVSKSGVLLPA